MRPIQKIDSDSIGGWGDVPTLGGDLSTALDPVADPSTDSTSPITTTATTLQQAATSSEQATTLSKALPPPPPPDACQNSDKTLSPAFYIWLIQLQRRVGGYLGSPTDDAQLIAVDPEIIDREARNIIQYLQEETPIIYNRLVDENPFDAGTTHPPIDTQLTWDESYTLRAWVTSQKYKSSDGSSGITATKTFYTAASSGGLPTLLNTVVIKDGLITSWT